MPPLPKFIREAIHSYVIRMEGWTEPERCCEIAACILEIKAQVCVDIGMYAGRSSVAMGFAARQLITSRVYAIDAWNPDIAVDNDDRKEGVDWWQSSVPLEEIHRQAVRAIWDHHLEQWVIILRTKSEYCYQLFPDIDLINIDGGHSELTSCRDVELYLPRVRTGGYVLFDDCGWPTTQKAIGMIEKECDLVNTFNGKSEARTYRKR